MGQEGLIIFVKNPELGKVKTRIAATVGDAEALRIYRELLGHTQRVTLQVDATRYLYYGNYINEADQWLTTDYHKLLQSKGDLGDRMHAAINHTLTQCSKAILIGSDCASLTPGHLQDALQKLDDADVVLGPTYDGGYYLIGMKTAHRQLFEGIEWSTAEVYQQTIAAAQQQDLSVATLPTLSDIDHEEDWHKYGW